MQVCMAVFVCREEILLVKFPDRAYRRREENNKIHPINIEKT